MFLLKLTADHWPSAVFDWIAGSCQINLWKTGQDCSEAGYLVNAKPGLKVNRSITFSSTASPQSYKTQIKSLHFPGLA